VQNNDNQKDLIGLVQSLKPKEKEPNSVRTLNAWIAHAEQKFGIAEGGRLSWLIATTIIIAKLQEVVDGQDQPKFLLKGGTLLQYRLGLETRATKDLDGLVCGDIDDFLVRLDERLAYSWGAVEFARGEIGRLKVPSKLVNPRWFEVTLSLRNKTWRKVRVEISPDEGGAGTHSERLFGPTLTAFGIPSPHYLVSMAMSYQIAQKIHAACSLHSPPEYRNDRVRDLVDLVLLRRFADETGKPDSSEIALAIVDTFNTRANEARQLGRRAIEWPMQITDKPGWRGDYTNLTKEVEVIITIDEAIDYVNEWLIKFSELTAEAELQVS